MAPYVSSNLLYDLDPKRFKVPNSAYSRFYAEKILFSSEELKHISKYFNKESYRIYPVTNDDLSIIPKGSSFTENIFTWDNETEFVYTRLKEWTKELMLEFEWKSQPWAEFRRYKKGDFFIRHYDTPWNHGGLPERYFTVGIQLNEEYEGGDFIIDSQHIMTKAKGNTVMWGVEVPHEVSLITQGIRETLICFIDVESGKVGKNTLI